MPPDDASPPAGVTIRTAQAALRQLGYDPGTIDGVLGQQTRAVILRFQRAQHLRATGALDPETWSAIAAQLMAHRSRP
jgi:peptidoglycan hydrolase-like protein with peptidoglycan-binding domain